MQRAVIGKHAPKFRVEAVFEEDFVDIELEKYRGKYVVLLFYQQDLWVKRIKETLTNYLALRSAVLKLSLSLKKSRSFQTWIARF